MVNQHPLISVICCAHNEEEYVDKSRPSILNALKGFSAEVLFVAERCTDNTVAYITEVLRVLKPDGVFIAQIPRLDHYRTLDPDADVYSMTTKEVEQAFIRYEKLEFLDFEFQYAYYLFRAVK